VEERLFYRIAAECLLVVELLTEAEFRTREEERRHIRLIRERCLIRAMARVMLHEWTRRVRDFHL
jgi:hypothetical protein